MAEIDSKRVTKEWLEEFLAGAFPGAIRGCAGVADFIRLVELERRMFPRKPPTPEVVWVDDMDSASD